MTSSITYRLRPRTTRLDLGHKILLSLGDRRLDFSALTEAERATYEYIEQGGALESLYAELCEKYGPKGMEQGEGIISSLLGQDMLEKEPIDHKIPQPDVDRLTRLLEYFSEFETENVTRYDLLSRLRNARVLVVGLGGLGSWVIYQLLCFGIGHLTLVDQDVVEASNLNRSILFSEQDIGRPKIAAAAEAISCFAPRTEVNVVSRRVGGPGDLSDLTEGVSVVLGLADRPIWLIRQWVAEACRETGVPGLQCGGGKVGPFHFPGRTSCLMCHFAALSKTRPMLAGVLTGKFALPSRATGGFSSFGGAAAGFIGHELFRYLSGIGEPLTVNRLWGLDGRDFTARYTDVPVAPDCIVCSKG